MAEAEIELNEPDWRPEVRQQRSWITITLTQAH